MLPIAWNHSMPSNGHRVTTGHFCVHFRAPRRLTQMAAHKAKQCKQHEQHRGDQGGHSSRIYNLTNFGHKTTNKKTTAGHEKDKSINCDKLGPPHTHWLNDSPVAAATDCVEDLAEDPCGCWRLFISRVLLLSLQVYTKNFVGRLTVDVKEQPPLTVAAESDFRAEEERNENGYSEIDISLFVCTGKQNYFLGNVYFDGNFGE